MTIFGQRAGPALLALVGQGTDALVGLTTEMENSGGTAQRIAETQLDTLQGELTLLKSAAEGLAISIGGALVPALRPLVEQVAAVVQNVVAWAEANPTLSKPSRLVSRSSGHWQLALASY